MDYTTKELLKRYAKLALGQPFAPVLLNILVTSVCDMRCTHCFFTDELDDRPRKELPEIVRAFYENNRLESVYLMSNGQIQKRILPDVTRILEECPNLNVTVALGIDGLKEQHEKIRQKPGSWDIAIDTARQLQAIKRERPQLDVQTCTCFMNSNQDTIFDWYDFLKYELRPDKVNFNYIRPPSADPVELDIHHARYARIAKLIDEDSLSSCENLEPVGSLREHGWDFQSLWHSEAMKARRKKAADGCFCTHESNCYYPSLPFNPKHLIQIKRLEREMKKASREHARLDEQAEGLT